MALTFNKLNHQRLRKHRRQQRRYKKELLNIEDIILVQQERKKFGTK